MGWETRTPGGPRYYTRSRKVGGRVVREYIGAGARGEAAAAADARRRAERQALAVARQEEQARLDQMDGLVLGLFDLVGLVASAALVTQGFHKHGGEWRVPTWRG